MCGICGVFTPDGAAAGRAVAAAVSAMTNMLTRRGPDSEGQWTAPGGRARFGFRRLGVIEPTAVGDQPMLSADGNSALVLNGEIYNYRELRVQLEAKGRRFRTRTDTEVLLASLAEWGYDALSRLNGMFAFAWFDGVEQKLLLARDHAGIKPLYYSQQPGRSQIAFASRYDVLLRAPGERPSGINPEALRLYLSIQHLPAPYTLFAETYQLAPGHCLTVRRDGRTELDQWWKLPEAAEPELRGDAAAEAVAVALDSAVRRQRIADVPLGVLLSGGVDSPLIAAIARSQTGPGLEAFTIGNPGWSQDESADAKRYADAIDLKQRLGEVSGEQALATLEDVKEAQYEPFGDFSILPTLLISRIAREKVTVALSGDGGDELFFGYERPLSLLRAGNQFRLPRLVRLLRYALHSVVGDPTDVPLHRSAGDYYFAVNSRMLADDLRAIAPGLPPLQADFRLYDSGPATGERGLADFSRRAEFGGQLQRGLKKVDMASMHHSLEVRVPMLDREVIEVSMRIDPLDSMRNKQRKAVLRDVLARFVPREIIPESKRGFSVPLADWLRGPLRNSATDALFSPALLAMGLFQQRGIDHYWQEHLSGARDNKWGIWTLMSLSWWLERNK